MFRELCINKEIHGQRALTQRVTRSSIFIVHHLYSYSYHLFTDLDDLYRYIKQ